MAEIANLSIPQLVDRLGAVRAEIAAATDREKELKAELQTRRVTEADGALFRLALVAATRWSLDTGRIKAEMGPSWYDAHCRQSVVTSFRVTPIGPSAEQLAAIAA